MLYLLIKGVVDRISATLPIAQLVLLARVVDSLVVERLQRLPLVVGVCREEGRARLVLDVGLLFPDLLNVVVHVGRTVAARSINGELHVKPHVCFSTIGSRKVLQCQVEWRRLIAASISLAVVEAEDAFDLLCTGNSLSDAVDLGLQVLFATYAARVCVALEAVRLHGGMLRSHTWARVGVNSLIHRLLGTLEYVVALVQREDTLRLAPLGLHLFLRGLDVVTSVCDGPANTDVLR